MTRLVETARLLTYIQVGDGIHRHTATNRKGVTMSQPYEPKLPKRDPEAPISGDF